VLQAPMLDGLSFGPFSLFDDGWQHNTHVHRDIKVLTKAQQVECNQIGIWASKRPIDINRFRHFHSAQLFVSI